MRATRGSVRESRNEIGVICVVGALRLTAALCLIAALCVATPAVGLEIQSIANGLDNPLDVTHAGDGSGRLFIVSQRGSIDIWDGAQILETPFLDIESRVSFGGSLGMLGLTFHPQYAENGRFYVNYTDLSGDTVISEFTVTADPNRADENSESFIFIEEQPFANHNGGTIAFGPDGYLYVTSGDGGSGGDPGDRAQDLSEALGKILRFDVDGAPPFIPDSNPFVSDPSARDEIWSYGLRNPWRMSFDRLQGDLFIADVGQDEVEEIDFQPSWSTGGENYGWRLMEGSECFDPPTDCNDGSLVLPVMEYKHNTDDGFQGCAVTGGYRYRGPSYGDLYGNYYFSDSCSGKIWEGTELLDGSWTFEEVLDTSVVIVSFGEDEAGDLYLVGSGTLYRVEGTGGVYCEIDTERDTYAPGEAVNLSLSQGSNNGTSDESVRTQLAVLGPAGVPIVFFDDTSLVETGETETYPSAVGTIPASAPNGTYSIGCRMTDVDSGELLFQGLARFRVQSSG